MIELVATVIITAVSVLLFGYWFRYTCILILSAKTTRDYAFDVATANQLSFLEVQSQLREATPDLDRLRHCLDRDYAIVTSLLKHATNISESENALETRMLAIHYRVMGAWYQVSRHFSNSAARKALDEMSMIVAHFANAIGERDACTSAA